MLRIEDTYPSSYRFAPRPMIECEARKDPGRLKAFNMSSEYFIWWQTSNNPSCCDRKPHHDPLLGASDNVGYHVCILWLQKDMRKSEQQFCTNCGNGAQAWTLRHVRRSRSSDVCHEEGYPNALSGPSTSSVKALAIERFCAWHVDAMSSSAVHASRAHPPVGPATDWLSVRSEGMAWSAGWLLQRMGRLRLLFFWQGLWSAQSTSGMRIMRED